MKNHFAPNNKILEEENRNKADLLALTLHRKYETVDQPHMSTQMELNFNFQNFFKMVNVKLSNPVHQVEYFCCLWSLTVNNIRRK